MFFYLPNTDGQLICNTTACSNLLKEDFILQLNALNYHIHLDNLGCFFVTLKINEIKFP